jgi:diamine N-acetyltransferase
VSVALRPTTAADLDFVLAAESDPEASRFVTAEPREAHEATIADPNQQHLIACEGEERLGYVMLCGVEDPNRVIEVRRIVIVERGRGLGREALRLVVDRAFRELGAHRVWLDVLPHNERALRAYQAVGFVHEGVMREAQLVNGVHESLAIMSILEHEWAERRAV